MLESHRIVEGVTGHTTAKGDANVDLKAGGFVLRYLALGDAHGSHTPAIQRLDYQPVALEGNLVTYLGHAA